MKLFRRKQPQPAPQRRTVARQGRTAAFSYYSQRSGAPARVGRDRFREALTARSAHQAARYWRQRFGVVIVLVAVVIGLYQLLALSTDPKIVPADSSQTTFLHPLATYHATAQHLLEGSLFNHNKLTIDTGGVTAELKRQYPELSVVTMDLPLVGHRPIIYVAPAASKLVLLKDAGQAFVIDTNGRAVAAASASDAARLRMPLVKDPSPTPVQVGKLALPSDTVAFIQKVMYEMNAKHMGISTFVLPEGTSELDMYLDGQAYYVKFNLASDTALEQVGDFLAVRHALQGRGATPAEYIDVRIPGRAYYK